MRTTTTVHGGYTHHKLSSEQFDAARAAYNDHRQKVLETFAKTHGCSSDNVVSETSPEVVSSFDPGSVTRAWPDLATAQAYVDLVLAGNLEQGLEFPIMIISSQVDPE